uniref:Uncharacterized protein n=1 Tax=Arundo donax TaxID=35708 RepID=A0A0A9B2B2_ARUDO
MMYPQNFVQQNCRKALILMSTQHLAPPE